jgi:hypothetical protein
LGQSDGSGGLGPLTPQQTDDTQGAKAYDLAKYKLGFDPERLGSGTLLKIVQKFLELMPLWFGIGFIAPLTAEMIKAFGWQASLPVTPLVAGLILGIVWGGSTVVRGRWI